MAYNDLGLAADKIASIERTDGTGQAGSLDTYTITTASGDTFQFQVQNGMNASVSIESNEFTDSSALNAFMLVHEEDVIAVIYATRNSALPNNPITHVKSAEFAINTTNATVTISTRDASGTATTVTPSAQNPIIVISNGGGSQSVDTALDVNSANLVTNRAITGSLAKPAGVYDTLAQLASAYPSGNGNVYVVRADNKWYTWSGSAWVAGGDYRGNINGNLEIIIQKWLPATNYYLGDLVLNDGVAYRCVVDYSRAIVFNSSQWERIKMQSYVENYSQEQKDINDTLIKNLLLIGMFEDGYYRAYNDGDKRELSGWSVTKLLEVMPSKSMYFEGGQAHIAYFDSSRAYISGTVLYNSSYTADGSIQTPANCKYMSISMSTSQKASASLVYGNKLEIAIPPNDLGGQKMREYIGSKNVLRNSAIFGTWKDNEYIPAGDGQPTARNGWSWKKISVNSGKNYYINKESHIAFFNGNTYVSGVVASRSGEQNHYVRIPENCNVMSVSILSTGKDDLVILEKKWHDAISADLVFEVGPQRRQFSRVFDCLEFIRSKGINNADVIIDAGTYDLIAEITASKGSSYITNFTTSDSFRGLFLGRNIKITGKGKVKIIANYTGSNTDFSSQVSVFHVYNNTFFMENIEVDVAGLRYAIHDDSHDSYESFSQKGEIKNCKFVNNGVTYGSLIGAGLFHNDLRVIENCEFINNNGSNDFNAISYHTNLDSYECTVRINNIYCENCHCKMIANGSSAYTSVMYVSNSKTPTPIKTVDAGYTDNVELHYWNIEN